MPDNDEKKVDGQDDGSAGDDGDQSEQAGDGVPAPPATTEPPAIDDETFKRLAEQRGFIPGDNVQKRIDELTRERQEALRMAEEAQKRAAEAQKPAQPADEWTEDRLNQAIDLYGDPQKETYNPQYARWAQDKLIEKKAEARARAVIAEEKAKEQQAGIARKAQEVYQALVVEYPDLNNPASPLRIRASGIYASDPWYQASPEGMRIAAQKAADELGIVSAKKTDALSKEKKKLQAAQDKNALAGAGVKAAAPSPKTVLDKLEAKAVASGSAQDWAEYQKALRKAKAGG